MNTYNVIYLDITEFTYAAIVKKDMQNIVSNIETSVINELSEAYPDVQKQDNLPKMIYSIADATKQKFIFIIDEWDALFREAKNDVEQQDAYIKLLRGLFKKSGITNKMIEAAYITGILPIKKYGTQSAMTDFREYTMLAPKKLAETYASLQFYIDMDEDGLKETIAQMLGGAHIKIDSGTFQNDMTTIRSRDDVLTLLVHLGYLAYDFSERSVYIPNEEIREEFVRAVTVGKHTEIAKLIRDSEHLLEATLNMDEEAVATLIEEAHKASVAPTFYNNEQALRSVIRVAYISCVDEFLRIEELPSGHGYADVVFIPKRTSLMPLMVIELKWNKTDEGAIRQIKNHDYPQVMKDYGGEILLVGINYDSKNKKHTCTMESYKK